MPTLLYSMACEKVVVSKLDNTVHLINVYEELSPPNLPSALPYPFVFLCLWEKSPGYEGNEPFQWRVRMEWEGGAEVIGEDEATIDRLRVRTILMLLGLPIHAGGKVTFTTMLRAQGDEDYHPVGQPFVVMVNNPQPVRIEELAQP